MKYFIFNGTDSRDLGLIVLEMPSVVIPKKDVEIIRVDGRSNPFRIDNGTYAPYSITLLVAVTDLTKTNQIKALYQGLGIIEFSDNLGVEYECVVKNQVPLGTYLNVLKEFPLQLEISPIGKSKVERVETITTNGIFEVEGTSSVYPIIEIKGDGGFGSVSINNISFNLQDLDNVPYMIDCDLMNVTKNNLQANDRYHGNFPSLKVGENTISFTGDITEIKIKYKEGWL